MPNLVDLLGQISLFAKLTMAVAIVAFGLAVAYRISADRAEARPDAAGFAGRHLRDGQRAARGLDCGARKHCSDAGWAPAGGESLSRHR